MVTDKEFRIAEIFGPTIQGEGVHAGYPCHFVRFGGCDYRCRWCDSPHAVLPELVAALPKMTAEQICNRVRSLPGHPKWVVLSGGNPALFDLSGVA
jgi:7-carboxy-7-deazaguanine synthase